MKHLVCYRSDQNHIGNVDCDFLHYPPTLEDVRNLEKDISTRYCNNSKVTVTGWSEIQTDDDIDKSKFNDCIDITINHINIRPDDKIELSDSYGNCIYIIRLGRYEYDNKMHIGWYMHVDLVSATYPIDHIIHIRPLGDLLSDDIKEWHIYHG